MYQFFVAAGGLALGIEYFTGDLALEPGATDGHDGRFYEDNPNALWLRGLANIAGQLVADATVTATLTRAGAELWSATLDPVAGSAGDYRAWLPYTLAVDPRDVVLFTVEAVSSTHRGEWDLKVRVMRRVG